MTAWSIHTEHRVNGELSDETLDAITADVDPYGGVAVTRGDYLGVRLVLEADDLRAAAQGAI